MIVFSVSIQIPALIIGVGESAIIVFAKQLVSIQSDAVIEPIPDGLGHKPEWRDEFPWIAQLVHNHQERIAFFIAIGPIDDQHGFPIISGIPKVA